MGLTARDVMSTEFDTVRPEDPISKAIKLTFKGKMRPTGHRTVCLMVTDEFGKLVGSVTMFDILYHFRPTFLQYDIEAISDWMGKLEPYLKQFNVLTVEQVMSRNVMTISPNDHLMVVIDNMIKKNIRRLPVIENSRIIGIVFLPDVYYHLFKTILD